MNWKIYMSVMKVNTGDELKAWVTKHMRENSPRELSYLLDLAETRNITVSRSSKRQTIVNKLVKDYDAGMSDL